VVAGTKKCRERQQPPQVQVGVVLPGVADSAEDLDGSVADGGQPVAVGLDPRRGEPSVLGVGMIGGPQRP
jgi:hypothetical protein